MKNINSLLIVCLILCSITITNAQQEKPIQINALIGDTLDLVERDYYSLFPTIDGFQYAVYSQYQDSLIKVTVYYLSEGEIRDTTNIIGLKSLENIRERVNKIDQGYRPNEMGKKISIKKLNGETIEGEFLYVQPNSIIIIPIYEPTYNLEEYIDLIESYKFSELSSVTIINESSFTSSCLRIGGLSFSGALVGGIIMASGSSSEGSSFLNSAFIGGIIFLAALVGSIVWAIVAASDEEIELIDDFDYKILRQYSRFTRFEPEYLKKFQ